MASRLLATTDRFFRFIVSDSWLAGTFRTRLVPNILALAMRFEKPQRFAFRTISQVGIRYPESPLSASSPRSDGKGPSAGDRFPWLRLKLSASGPVRDLFEELDDTRFTLIAVGQPAPAGDDPRWRGLLRTLAVPADPENDRALKRREIPSPSFYLLRPDGHVGLCGGLVEPSALARYFSERVRLPPRS